MEKEEEKISNSIKRILKENHLLTLSTYGKNIPYSNTAFYTYDKNMNLYLWSEQGTLHTENIRKNRKVAVNIFDSRQKWGSLLRGLQAFGTAKTISNKELVLAGILYIKRFPGSLKMVKHPKRFHDKLFESKIYKIQLDEIKVLDERVFGKGGSRRIFLKRKNN